MESFRVLGLMSGTSLDGLDVVDVAFSSENQHLSDDLVKWNYKIHNAITIAYPDELKNKLKIATSLPADQLLMVDKQLGEFFGASVNSFLKDKKLSSTSFHFVASHGHTIFHQPNNGITLQIGNGPEGAARSKLPWVCDFRTMDVANGGQGAPLVPVGDAALFLNEADSFLNIGGFCNISFQVKENWQAFDIAPANLILNRLANRNDLQYDKDGALGKEGKINRALLDQLDALPYYTQKGAKSLGTEWLEDCFYPLIDENVDTVNVIRTCYEHLAFQVVDILHKHKLKSVFITGGGTHNSFLIELIKSKYKGEIIIPDTLTIDFKEALIFAYLGLLRVLNKTNVSASVTGANKDSCAGIVYLP